jgi:hypothetical protein
MNNEEGINGYALKHSHGLCHRMGSYIAECST